MFDEVGSEEWYDQCRQEALYYSGYRAIEKAADECFYLSQNRSTISNIYERNY
tara:strand:- start:184 stop:342 length:159 start_codon:yes stop_codon:yes gene_type:complete